MWMLYVFCFQVQDDSESVPVRECLAPNTAAVTVRRYRYTTNRETTSQNLCLSPTSDDEDDHYFGRRLFLWTATTIRG
jgi:hypothetical protein